MTSKPINDIASPVRVADVPIESGSGYPEPFKSRMGEGHWRQLGDVFQLSQFGVNIETLAPGAQSALRHWHSLSDEFIYLLSGELTLRTDAGESVLTAGMCMGFKAGDNNAHHLINQSEAEAQFIVIGTRVPGDVAFYPDDDLAWLSTEQGRVAIHKNGDAYPS